MTLENQKEFGPDKEFVESMIIMLETGSDYLEDLVSVLKDLNKEAKFEDLDKDKYYEEAANKERGAVGQS